METNELAKLLGISHQFCNRLKKRGMPTVTIEAAIEWRRKSIDVRQTKHWRIDGNPGKHANETLAIRNKPIEELKRDVNATQLDLETKDADTLFKNARVLKEKALALQAAAEHEQQIGLLIEKKIVEKVAFDAARQFRDGLMICSVRLAPEIACQTDITKIEMLLNREFRELLENFVNSLAIKEN